MDGLVNGFVKILFYVNMCKDKGTSFQTPAVANPNQLFSEAPTIFNRFFSEPHKAYRRKHKTFI